MEYICDTKTMSYQVPRARNLFVYSMSICIFLIPGADFLTIASAVNLGLNFAF